MMNAIFRLFIGLVLAILLFVGVINLTHLRRDAYLPPTACLDGIDTVAPGTVTGLFERGYGDHWWAGVDYRWYVGYTFTPVVPQVQPDGSVKDTPGTQPQAGEVRISEADYNNEYKVNGPIAVSYDSFNPIISCVKLPDSLAWSVDVHNTPVVVSRTAGMLSGWVRYPIGILVVAILIGEVLKRWIKQGDI